MYESTLNKSNRTVYRKARVSCRTLKFQEAEDMCFEAAQWSGKTELDREAFRLAMTQGTEGHAEDDESGVDEFLEPEIN